MKKGRWLVFGLLGMVLAVGLSGCVVSTSPGTEDVILMNPGETKVFKVSGVNLNTPLITMCRWSIDRKDGNPAKVFVYTDHIEFTANPEGEKSNRVIITCEYYRWLYVPFTIPGYWVFGSTDSSTWNICIPRDTAPVWQGDYYIAGRTDVQMLNGYTEITGDLDIINSNLKSLEGLENLTNIGGDLYILGNDALTNLSGLENLASVGGDLAIGEFYYMGNAALTSLSGLESLTSVGGELMININNELTSLSGLENLTSVGGGLNIGRNSALTSLSSLENLTSVGGYLAIWENTALTSLSGLENLTSVGGDLWIHSNYALTSLEMTGLQRVDGYFEIYYNPLLCTSLAEDLMNQVLAGGGIGGTRSIHDNKECTTP